MRIGIYARVSTKDQSCELQVLDLKAYCTARGFDLVREYVDVGQSGAKDSRPELNKLMTEAESVNGKGARAKAWGEIDTKLVEKAIAVPFDWDKQANLQGKTVHGVGQLHVDVTEIRVGDLNPRAATPGRRAAARKNEITSRVAAIPTPAC